MMNAILSGVHSEAATNRSPSFSRSSSSVTTTISPPENAASTASLVLPAPGKRPCRRLAQLPALTQIVIGDHACQHGLADRHRANADAGVVAPLGADLGLGSIPVDGAPRGQDRRGRLDHETADDRLPGRDAA